MSVEALIISCGEPQLEKCLTSVKNQLDPFVRITHIEGVVPEYAAFKKGTDLISEDWMMLIGGDFVLYENATKLVKENMGQSDEDKTAEYIFGLDDAFLKRVVCGCHVYRVSALKSIAWNDSIDNDARGVQRFRRGGWLVKELWREVIVGSHAEDCTNFQVFQRFYARGVKQDHSAKWRLKGLQALATSDSRYELAIKAMEFGQAKRHYPTSHNIEFDKQMFEEFRRSLWIS